jgi:hypothetical protein
MQVGLSWFSFLSSHTGGLHITLPQMEPYGQYFMTASMKTPGKVLMGDYKHLLI